MRSCRIEWDLCHGEPSAGGEVVLGGRRRVLVDAVELPESQSTGRLEAVDGRLAVPDGRRRRMTASHSVLVHRSQRTRMP